MREYDKCYFCQNYKEEYECCFRRCSDHRLFEVDDDKIFEKAKESGLSVADVIALMKVED